jgi:hypothetical protein
MSGIKAPKVRLNVGLTKEVVAVVISMISFAVSIVGFYTSSLKAPDLHFYTAPYIRHIVDSGSRNEAFYIPITLANRGARQGTLVSVNLIVTYLGDGSEKRYFGQYFAQANTQDLVGGFFTPLTLNGYSSDSRTICFYPLGVQSGSLFSRAGEYEFHLTGSAANVRGESEETVADAFRVTVDAGMVAAMQAQADGEYIYPIPVERMP